MELSRASAEFAILRPYEDEAVDVTTSTSIPRLPPQRPSSQRVAPCQWHCDVRSAQQGRQDVHEMPGPVGSHVVMNHALQCPLEALHHSTFAVIILSGEEEYVSGLEQSLDSATCISVPLSLCTASGDPSCMSSRMACMAPAVSVPRLLVRGGAQAYLENTSMQQKRYPVPSLASRYSLQSTRSNCSCSLGQTRWSAVGGSSSAPAGAACNFPGRPGLFQWPY